MDINQLSSFVSVVKNQSFTKAANELFISQPTEISSHIKNLEQELNKQLIIRSTKNITITSMDGSYMKLQSKFLILRIVC